MGKRSNFTRRDRDFYPSPREAVLPLLPHLEPGASFIEPCAGAGDLVRHLRDARHPCIWAFDTHPQSEDVQQFDAFDMRMSPWRGGIQGLSLIHI